MLSDLGWGEDRGPLREKRFSLCHQVSSFQLSYPLQGFLEWETLTNCLWLLDGSPQSLTFLFQGLLSLISLWLSIPGAMTEPQPSSISMDRGGCYSPSWVPILNLPYLAVPHEGSGYAVHTLSSPDPNNEVWREKSDLLPYFPLEEVVGRINLTVSGSKLNPRPT